MLTFLYIDINKNIKFITIIKQSLYDIITI